MSGANSRVKLLVEIATQGAEELKALESNLRSIFDLQSSSKIVSGTAAQTKALGDLVKTEQRVGQATKARARAQQETAQATAAQASSTRELVKASQEDLRVQQQRLKQALLYKREAAEAAKALEEQRRKTAEATANYKAAVKAQSDLEREARKSAAAQEKLAKALDAANKKLAQQALAADLAKRKSMEQLQAAVGKVQDSSAKEAAKAAEARAKAEARLTAELAKQQAAMEALKQKEAQAQAEAKRLAAAQQAVLKESLRKKQALRELQRELEAYKRKLNEAKNQNNEFADRLENLAQSAALVTGPLGGIASRISTLAQILRETKPLIAGTVVALGTLATAYGFAIFKAGQSEAQLAKIDAIIRATGSAAGFTANQVNNMAKSLASANLGDVTEARDAIAKLLTFRGIQTDNFERALVVMGDMAAVFGSMDEASVQLGKALEDPIQGLGSLREIGVSVTQQQQDMIKELQQSGNLWLAQKEILAILESQIGGAGAAQGAGLVGAVERLHEAISSLFTTIGSGGALNAATRLFNDLATAINRAQNMIDGSTIDKELGDISEKLEVLSKKRADAEAGRLDKSILGTLDREEEALKTQARMLTTNKGLLERRIKLQKQLADEEKKLELDQKLRSQAPQDASTAGLVQAVAEPLPLKMARAGRDAWAAVVGDRESKVKDLRDELTALNAELKDYVTAENEAATAAADSNRAIQQSQGRAQQQQQIKDNQILQKRLNREFAQERVRTFEAQTDAEVRATEEAYRRKEIPLEQYLAKRTELEQKQAARTRDILSAELLDAKNNYDERVAAIAETNKKIAESGGLQINPEQDEQAIRLLQQYRVAQEELNRQTFSAQEQLAVIAKTRREETERLGKEAEQQAKESEREAKKRLREQEELQKKIDDATTKRIRAALELRSIELDNADAVAARLSLAADQVAEQYREVRNEIAKALGESQTDVVDQLIDAKTVEAQFDQVDQIFQERISRLNTKVANLQVLQQRSQIGYSDFVQGAADAYAEADTQLKSLLDSLRRMAEESGSSALLSRLKELENQLYTTATAGEEFTNSVVEALQRASGSIAEAGFQSFFDSLFNNITDLEGAFRSLALTILQEMSKVVSSRIAKEFGSFFADLIGGSSSGGSSGGGSSWFSTAASVVGSFFGGGGSFADGGYIRGPGTTRSDSIVARLSDKEFVQNARAVQYYGVDVMSALNRMMIPKSALRGVLPGGVRPFVPHQARFADGGQVNVALQAQSTPVPGQPIVVSAPPVYNMLDTGELMTSGLGTKDGQRAFYEFFKRNGRDLMNLLPKQRN